MSENVVLQVEGLCFAYPECGVLNQWSVALPAANGTTALMGLVG